jgi:hypothetical protein
MDNQSTKHKMLNASWQKVLAALRSPRVSPLLHMVLLQLQLAGSSQLLKTAGLTAAAFYPKRRVHHFHSSTRQLAETGVTKTNTVLVREDN